MIHIDKKDKLMPEQTGGDKQTQMIYRPENGLSDSDNLRVERRQDASFETFWQGKGSAGNLTYHHINTRKGLDIWRFEHLSSQPAHIVSQENSPAFALRFCLCGETWRYHTMMNRRFGMKGGQQDLFFTHETENISSIPINQALDLIAIFVSEECLLSWLGDDVSWISEKLHAALMDKGSAFFRRNSEMTQDMLNILGRMIQCPYTGLLRKLFYESCALELLCLQLDDLPETRKIKADSGIHHRSLHPDERLKIRRIVKRFNDDPGVIPSLTELAREAGMSQSKLSRLFRQEYGTTVFTYLRNIRLDLATQMLSQGMTVTETALSVGYENLSHFSKLFKMRFGKIPSRF